MDDEYKYLLYFLGLSFICIIFTSAFGNFDLDEVCATDDVTLYRVDGAWTCSTIHLAEIYYHSYSAPFVVPITANDTYYRLNVSNTSKIVGFTINDSGLITNKAGNYKINGVLSFSGGNNGEYEVEVHINDMPQPNCAFFRSTTTTKIGVGALTCLVTLNVNDITTVKIKDISSPYQDVNFQQFSFNIMEIR